MQGTGRRSAPSLFCHFASHRTVRRALFRTVCQALLRTACQALLRTAWRPPAPAPPSSPAPSPHRRLRRSRVVRIIAAHRAPSAFPSAPTVHAAVRIFVRRPSPACRIPDLAVPRACRCPAAFFRTSGVCFAHVTQQMYAHLLNMLKINILQSRRKRQPPDRKQVAFFRFPGRTARRYRSVICTMLFFAYIGGRLSLTPYLHEKTCTQNALCRSHRAHGIAPLLPEG